jgi:hypothetical protein
MSPDSHILWSMTIWHLRSVKNPGRLRGMWADVWAACLAAATVASCNDDFDTTAGQRFAGLARNSRVSHELGDALWLENLVQAGWRAADLSH